MRQFESGATRDTEDGKLDYEGFLSPAVLLRFASTCIRIRYKKMGLLERRTIGKKAYHTPLI